MGLSGKSLLEHPHIFFSGQKFSYVCTNLDEMQIRFELITIKVRDITFVLEYTCIKCLFALNKDIFLRCLVYGVLKRTTLPSELYYVLCS